MKIHITGNAGSGKTTLARTLSSQLNISSHSLDRIVWQPHWKKTPNFEREAATRTLTGQNDWIIEGVSSSVRSQSDLVIFLDISRIKCFWRCVKRNTRFLFRSRPELPPHCPEILIVPKLLQIIWRFPKLVGDQIRMEAQQSEKFVTARSQRDVDRIIEQIKFAT